MTSNPPASKGSPHSALDMFAPNPRTHHRRLNSQSGIIPKAPGSEPHPVRILKSLSPVYDVGATRNPPSLKARSSESSVSSVKYSRASTPLQSSSTLEEHHPQIPSNSTFSRVKQVASQLMRSKRVETLNPPSLHGSSCSPAVPEMSKSSRKRSSTISPAASTNFASSSSSSSLLPLIPSDGDPVRLEKKYTHPRSLSTRPTLGEHVTVATTASHSLSVSLAATETLESNANSSHVSTGSFSISEAQPRPALSNGNLSRKRGYESYPTDKTKASDSINTNVCSNPPLSPSKLSLPIPLKALKTGPSNKNFLSNSQGRSRRVTLGDFPPFEDPPKDGIDDKSSPGTPGARQIDHTNVLNGEWNQPNMQHVIDKLRALR
ncbi:hypothetical protein CVT25_001916 [Psilocybe cyanescens]|uniref:Uncharacterized protein n=1 Tax=Psilocybe cyanescens TaxID=93625 RepID=A0A409WQL3_PSICY|nr:hypothetical protein CVT25_001916 [Psilocybe cyanescens]